MVHHMSHLMTKPTKWHVLTVKTQISLGIYPVWSVFTVSMKKAWVLSLPIDCAANSDQTVRMPRLIRVFAGRTCHFVAFVMRRLNYIRSPGQGQTIHWGQNFDDNRKAFPLCPHVASFKMISSKSDFIHIFNDFIHVYSPGARTENPLGTNFWCQQMPLSLRPFVAKIKQISLNSNLYTFFNVFPHVYSPGTGADNPLWTKFWYQQRGIVTLPICCKFKKISLKSVFIQVYSPGEGVDNPLGSEFLF